MVAWNDDRHDEQRHLQAVRQSILEGLELAKTAERMFPEIIGFGTFPNLLRQQLKRLYSYENELAENLHAVLSIESETFCSVMSLLNSNIELRLIQRQQEKDRNGLIPADHATTIR